MKVLFLFRNENKEDLRKSGDKKTFIRNLKYYLINTKIRRKLIKSSESLWINWNSNKRIDLINLN